MKPRTKDRILSALDLSPMTPSELATALCEKYTTIRAAMQAASRKGLVKPIGTKRISRIGPNAFVWARA